MSSRLADSAGSSQEASTDSIPASVPRLFTRRTGSPPPLFTVAVRVSSRLRRLHDPQRPERLVLNRICNRLLAVPATQRTPFGWEW